MKIVVNCCNTALLVSGIGTSGDAGPARDNIFGRSRVAATALSLDEGTGMMTCVGNHSSVSAIRSARVVHTHTR